MEKEMTFFEELKWRGLIKDISSPDLEKKLNEESVTFYWGTDPTADSLHLGHYSSLLTAKRLMMHGHKPSLLVGGATGLIGDPRPTAEREIISKETVLKNVEGIRNQVTRILDGKCEVVNNYDWTKDITILDFFRDIGKYINVNYILNKDIISRRLENGITYAEFSYTLLQGNDFLHLFKNKNCILQAAGSDQWGNITTGIELIRKIEGKEAYGFTMPLILDATGKKFGKSEGNALWLDKNKTSAYEIYQYLINTDDSKVVEYLKVFTFLTKAEIEELEKSVKEEPEKRLAQKALAYEVVKDLHGKEEADKAIKISGVLFGGSLDGLNANDIISGMKQVPTVMINGEVKLIDLLVDNNICSSKREAREMLSAGAISLNNEKYTDENAVIDNTIAIDNKVIVIRKGKKKQFIGIFE